MQNSLSAPLVTLCDGRQGIRGGIHVEISEPPAPADRDTSRGATPDPSTLDPGLSTHVLDFVSSDETLDRYSEIISASGWDLANYQRNPVFQNAHQYGDVIFTLGKALVTEVQGGQLRQRIQFATDINPMARIAYGLYRGKFLNAVSVGFVPIRWENGTDKTSYRRKYLEQELLEVSAVGIPANPNALAMAYKSGAIEKSDLRELSDLIRLTLESSPRTQFFNVARELTRILKS
jgi:HK97 family phage prohead protease